MTRILVSISILFNSIINVLLFRGSTVNTNNISLLEKIFWPLNNVRYGYWLAKRWFLPVIAISTLIPWLFEQNRLLTFIKNNKRYIFLIFVFLFVARILSFSHWFYLDDFRFLGNFLQQTSDIQNIPCCGEGYPAQWMIYLVMRWFGTNFYLYNALGLVTYFLIGVCIFAIGNKIQNNKFVSLLSALFFVTTPTYFHATIAMVDHTGDSFSLLLFSISLFFLLNKSISRCLIFAAASLEFGLSRTHFIALPLVIAALIYKNSLGIKNIIVIIISLILISLPYYPVLAVREAGEYNAKTFFFNVNNVLISTNAISHALIPFQILKTVGFTLTKFSSTPYLSPAIGSLILLFLLIAIIKSPKTFILGGSIIVASLIFPPMFGVRTDRQISSFTRELQTLLAPSPATGYGLFPAFGLAILLVANTELLKNKYIKQFFILLILINCLSFIYADHKWTTIHVAKDKEAITVIRSSLSSNNFPKGIILDPSANVIRRNISTAIEIYKPGKDIIITDNINDPTLKNREKYYITYDGINNKVSVIITDQGQ